MDSIIDYVAWRGDLRFEQAKPCAIDLLIFAQLVHAPLERLHGGGQGQTLSEMESLVYPEAPDKNENTLERSRFLLWQAAQGSARFVGVTLDCFVSRFDPETEKQFAAALFRLEDGTGVVSFRGTDMTLVGWREDFNLAFISPIPSQLDAVNFLAQAAQRYDRLYVCGHSKGGNLALFSAAHCGAQAQQKILEVFNFDGPGLDDNTLESDGYRAVSPRVSSFIPESSIIGLLLGYCDSYTVIESDSVSIWQHNPYYWHVRGPAFVEAAGTTRSSRFTDLTLHAFLKDCTPDEQRVLVETLFNALDATGARSTSELPRAIVTHIPEIVREVKNLPAASREALSRTLRALAGAGTENLRVLLESDSPS